MSGVFVRLSVLLSALILTGTCGRQPPTSPSNQAQVNDTDPLVGGAPGSAASAASTCGTPSQSSPGNIYPCCENNGNCTWCTTYQVRLVATNGAGMANGANTAFTTTTGTTTTPTITNSSPPSAPKNQATTFTLTGTNFVAGFTGTLINEVNQSFNITDRQFVNANQVRVTVFLGAGPIVMAA